MTDYELDRIARRVLLDAARLEYGGLMEELPEHTFSLAFERRTKKLLRRGRHPIWYRTLHAAACVLLALILSGCAVLAASPEIRDVFAGWVREVYETAFVYRYTGPERTEPCADADYELTWLPEGYWEAERPDLAGMVNVLYRNDAGEMVVLAYTTEPEAFSLSVYTGNATAQKTQVNGRSADLYLDNQEGNRNLIVWTGEETGPLFCISGPQGEDELVKMAESVERFPEPPLEERRLTWVPAGYRESSRVMMGDQGHVQYQNEEGDLITLSYQRGVASLQLIPSSDRGLERRTVLVDGRPADLYLDEGASSALVWVEDGLLFSLLGYCSVGELAAMAESQEVISPDRRPSWVPEGYAVYERSFRNSAVYTVTIYENPEGETIIFRCQPNGDAGRLHLFPNEGSVEKRVFVGGHPADLFSATKPGSRSEICWSDGEALYFLSGDLSDEEMLNIAESVGNMPPLPATHIPTWLPLGYRNTSVFRGLWSVEAEYENEAGEWISFRFARRRPAEGPLEECLEAIRKAVEDLEGQEVSVDGCPGRLYSKADGVNHLVWGPKGEKEVYWLSGPLSGEVLLEIAGGVNRTAE